MDAIMGETTKEGEMKVKENAFLGNLRICISLLYIEQDLFNMYYNAINSNYVMGIQCEKFMYKSY
jgi:hypothetical protein